MEKVQVRGYQNACRSFLISKPCIIYNNNSSSSNKSKPPRKSTHPAGRLFRLSFRLPPTPNATNQPIPVETNKREPQLPLPIFHAGSE